MLTFHPFKLTAYFPAFLFAFAASLAAQTLDNDALISPYGGPPIEPGSLGPTRAGARAIHPSSQAPICASTQPCVLTGQYNSLRNSQNPVETTLAGMKNFSSFAAVNFFPLEPTDVAPGKTQTPIASQPLYLMNVPVNGVTHNMLLVSTLNDSVYAFDADTGATLWSRVGSTSLAADCSPTDGQAFTDIQANGEPGIPTLAYYGIISTPVVDVAPADPVMYVTSACTTPAMGPSFLWYLNAIDITTGDDLIPGGMAISGANFTPTNELQRPSLLLTHPQTGSGTTGTFLYAAFGAGVFEQAGGAYSYNGAVFGWTIQYPFTIQQLGNPFLATQPGGPTSNVFPPGTAAPCQADDCYDGDNWLANGGGIWNGGKGLASDPAGHVYVAVGNGPFACSYTGAVPTECTNPAKVVDWGESLMEFAPPTGATVGTPINFFTPYAYSYPVSDPNPAPYEFEELNRLDLDMGTSGVVLYRQAVTGGNLTFAIESNKIGDLYVLPTNGRGLGQFQPGDAGLAAGSVTTQPGFQASRRPNSSDLTTICPQPEGTGQIAYNCDTITEIASWSNYLFVWPKSETVRAYQGTLTQTGEESYNLTFNTTPAFDPCPSPDLGCGGYPAAAYPGGMMAIAANGTTDATLWVIAPPANETPGTRPGVLYAYSISTSPSLELAPAWSSTRAYPSSCAAPPAPLPLEGWQIQQFTEPTVANGKVYVGVLQATTSTGSVIAGVLVFGNCTPAE